MVVITGVGSPFGGTHERQPWEFIDDSRRERQRES